MRRELDLSLYLVTDRGLMSTATLEEGVRQAIEGGCTAVQLREKEAGTREFVDLATRIKAVTDNFGVPLIVNDRIDVALAVDAAGAHIGSGDMPVELARKMLGEDKVLGVSAATLEEAVRAEAKGADYLGVGAMFATSTKTDAASVPKGELARICRSCSVPVVAIGGINESTLPLLEGAGADGYSVVSAVLAARDVRAAAKRLRTMIEETPPKKRAVINGVEWAIFDLDGTLLNSMDIWERIDVEFLSKRGFEVPPDYINEICARNFREAAVYTRELFGLPEEPRELIEEWRGMARREYEHRIELKPYAKEYLLSLKRSGIKLAVATSLPPSLFEPALRRNGVYGLFDGLFSAEEVTRGKEYPDFFYYVTEQLRTEPSKCVIFEDVSEAVKSAKETGAKVCGIFDPYSLEFLPDILACADCYAMSFSKAPILEREIGAFNENA